MTIRLELNTTRKKKDGTYPICVKIQDVNKKKRISTGISAKKSHWHRTNEKLKDEERFKGEQKILNSLKAKYKACYNALREQGIIPTIDLIISGVGNQRIEESQTTKTNFIDIVQEYADNCLNKDGEKSYNTKRLYESLKRFLIKHYGSFLDVSVINTKEGYRDYISLLNREKKDKNPMKNRMNTWLLTVLRYAQDNDYIDAVRIGKVRRFEEIPDNDKLNLTQEQITELILRFKKTVNRKNPRYDKFTSGEIALYLWILHIMFQGINNVDMFKLRKQDIEIKTIKKIDKNLEKYYNNVEYRQNIDKEQQEKEVIEINITRKKVSNAPVKILVDKDTIEPLLELFYYDKRATEYLVHNKLDPNLQHSDEEFMKARTSFYNIKQDQLNRLWKTFFTEDEWDSLPTLTYAHTRHAFINRLYDLAVKENIIGKLVGHGGITLDYYIDNRIPEWEHSEIVSKIFNDESSIKELLEERDRVIQNDSERLKHSYIRQDYGKSQYVPLEEYRKKDKTKN